MTVITIAGLPGSGSTTTAKLLAEKLDLNYFSPGQLFKDISRGTYKNQFYYKEFNKICDENNLIIPEFSDENDSHGATNLWQTSFGKSKELHNVLDKLQVVLARKGDIVLDGKLSLYMIPDSELKVWLKADFEERIKRSSKRDNVSESEVKKLLEIRQEKQDLEWKKIYGIRQTDQENMAQLVIDTTSISSEEVLNKILKNLP